MSPFEETVSGKAFKNNFLEKCIMLFCRTFRHCLAASSICMSSGISNIACADSENSLLITLRLSVALWVLASVQWCCRQGQVCVCVLLRSGPFGIWVLEHLKRSGWVNRNFLPSNLPAFPSRSSDGLNSSVWSLGSRASSEG